VRHQHQIAPGAGLPDQRPHLADLRVATLRPAVEIAERRPGLRAPERQPRGLEAPAPGTAQHAVDGDATRAKGLADLTRVPPPLVAEIPLRGAVVETHARRIAHARRRDGVPDQDHLPAAAQQGP